jgi:hypothetical protein
MLDVVVEGHPLLKAYATKRVDKTVMTCLINKGATDVDFEVKLAMDGKASMVRLAGPALDATTGITLGGAQVMSRGTWETAGREPILLHQGQMKIHVPAASAAIVEVMGDVSFAK